MFIDLLPGNYVRLGSAGTLVLLDLEGDRVQFALEGVDVGWESDGEIHLFTTELEPSQ